MGKNKIQIKDAVIMVIEDQGRFLFIQRAEGESAAGYWCPVSGEVEAGETQERAVVREVWEEVGMVVEPCRKIGESLSSTGKYRLHWWVANRVSGQAEVKSPEISAVKWVTLAEIELLEPTFDDNKAVFRSLRS